MPGMENEELLKLYELSINEEHHFLDAHQNRVAFYCGILSALFAGTVAGFFQVSEWPYLAFLCVGPMLIFFVSKIAIDGTFRFYQLYLESVTVRAKIEQELGLTRKPSVTVDANVTDSYWQSEPLIPPRHLKDRKESNSAQNFIEERKTKGYQLRTRLLFRGFQWISVLMLVGIVVGTILMSVDVWKPEQL